MKGLSCPLDLSDNNHAITFLLYILNYLHSINQYTVTMPGMIFFERGKMFNLWETGFNANEMYRYILYLYLYLHPEIKA